MILDNVRWGNLFLLMGINIAFAVVATGMFENIIGFYLSIAGAVFITGMGLKNS